MTPRNPPKLASWLLQYFRNGRHTEALRGDLHEQYANGKSAAWYWQQVCVAAAKSLGLSLRTHAFPFLSAMAAAWCGMLAWLGLHEYLTTSLVTYLDHHHTVTRANYHEFWTVVFLVGTAIRFAMFTLSGWMLARLFPAHRHFALIVLIATAALWRFVPQRIAPVYDPWTHMFLHLASAVCGLMIGALILGRPKKQAGAATS